MRARPFLAGLLSIAVNALGLACQTPRPEDDAPAVVSPRDAAPTTAAPTTATPTTERSVEGAPRAVPAPDEPGTIDDEPLPPLSPAQRRRLAEIRPDPPPKRLVRDTHYFISNEQSHFLWRDDVAAVGGAFVGVATDQNYLLAGWARPELLVLMDFDAGVVDLHHAYGVMFGEATTPTELLALWSAEREDEVVARLRAELPAAQAEPSIEAYRAARALVEQRLRKVDAQYRALEIPTFLSDAEQYDHLRMLWRHGRVIAVRGDLTADATMVDIGAALHALGLEVGVLYLSNAEQYLKYGPAFRRNVIALPMADEGVVLRTHGWPQFGYVAHEEYHYNVQPAPLFATWMAQGRARSVPAMLEHRTKTKTRGVSRLDRPPETRRGQPGPEIAP